MIIGRDHVSGSKEEQCYVPQLELADWRPPITNMQPTYVPIANGENYILSIRRSDNPSSTPLWPQSPRPPHSPRRSLAIPASGVWPHYLSTICKRITEMHMRPVHINKVLQMWHATKNDSWWLVPFSTAEPLPMLAPCHHPTIAIIPSSAASRGPGR